MMSAPNPWFPYRKIQALAKTRLFCLPPAGGGASIFRSWQELSPPGIEICAVQLPGREARIGDDLIPDMPTVVEAVALAMAPLCALPFAIFGHSMGGLIGFEVARHLQKQNKKLPVHLFVSACRAPHMPDKDGHHLLSDDQLIVELRKEGGYPEEILGNHEMMELLFPLIRADAKITETYTFSPGVSLDCPITTFIGQSDAKITRTDMNGWSKYTTTSFAEHEIHGDHSFVKTMAKEVLQFVGSALK